MCKNIHAVGKCRLAWEAWRKKCQKEDEEGRLLLATIAGKLETILWEKGFEVRKL